MKALFENLFGFQQPITKQKAKELSQPKSFVSPDEEDGAALVQGSGAYGTYIDFNGNISDEHELVNKYRQMSTQPEVDMAVDDVVNDAIVSEPNKPPVSVVLDRVVLPEATKTKISKEFDTICQLLNFQNEAYNIFRKWYVDGRLNYHAVINEKDPSKGIEQLRYIDPRQIKKVKQIDVQPDKDGNPLMSVVKEFFVFNHKGFTGKGSQSKAIEISPDVIIHCHSGLLDHESKHIISHLHKAIKALNQLRMIEDAVVIYRIARAPERRIFYIDVGNLPKTKAEQYMNNIMTKYKNRLLYNPETGEVKDKRQHLSMLEDFWLPRREGSNGTEIDTLSGGQNLGEIADIEYFQKRLYRALNVPVTRLESDDGFGIGRSESITRDEVKFSKFITRLRNRFSHLFDELLERQLVLKGIIKQEQWNSIKEKIQYDFLTDSYFTELKDTEILRERLGTLEMIESHMGTLFSKKWAQKNILRMTEAEIKAMDAEIKSEANTEDEDDEPINNTDNFNSDDLEQGDDDA